MNQYIKTEEYRNKVYAGVLGKAIGVYLGRPFEGWEYKRIKKELGYITEYMHERLNVPLIVTDDDISGTFTFLRALEDNHYNLNITAKEIGNTWLNYLVEEKSILWWGGYGNSTEHTAFLNLKNGIQAPFSGSIAQNGIAVAEQIGAQIFIDGWALIAPGEPELSYKLAEQAALVSHDGEAVYASCFLAVLESLAFHEKDINILLDRSLTYIPENCKISILVREIRKIHSEISDWEEARQWLEDNWGYQFYPGNCHVIPNHGLIILALLYGEDDFHKSQMIVNTSGWDTDCNAGNLGCLNGIRLGLDALTLQYDFRTPISDRMIFSTADGGRSMTDAVKEARYLIETAHKINKLPFEDFNKGGKQYHFNLPGSVQAFMVNEPSHHSLKIENIPSPWKAGEYLLRVNYFNLSSREALQFSTPTFMPTAHPESHYRFIGSPQLYSGETITAQVKNGEDPVTVKLYYRYFGTDDRLISEFSEPIRLEAAQESLINLKIKPLGGFPVAEVGFSLCDFSSTDGELFIDWVDFDRQLDLQLTRPLDEGDGMMWRFSWVDAYDAWLPFIKDKIRFSGHDLTQPAMMYQGLQSWSNYDAHLIFIPHIAKRSGLIFGVQGLKRYYALALEEGSILLMRQQDENLIELQRMPYLYQLEEQIALSVHFTDDLIQCYVNNQLLFEQSTQADIPSSGAVGIFCSYGAVSFESLGIKSR